MSLPLLGVGPARRFPPPQSLFGQKFEPTTKAFANRLSKMPYLAEVALDNIMKAMRLYGISLDVLYATHVGGSLAEAGQNVIGPSFPITWFNSPTFGADGGVSLNGVNQYGDLGLNLATYGGGYTLNDCCMGMLVINPVPANSFEFGARQTSPNGTYYAMLRALNTGNKPGFFANFSNQQQWPYKIGAGPTFIAFTRKANPGVALACVNGSFLPISTASQAVPNANVLLGLAGTRYSADSGFAIFFIGPGQLASQIAALQSGGESSLIAVGSIQTGLGTGSVAQSDTDTIAPLNPGLLSSVSPAALIVQRNSPPPVDDYQTAATFNAFPGNMYMLGLGDLSAGVPQTTWTGGSIGLQFWTPGDINRRNGKANPLQLAPQPIVSGVQCRPTYTTKAKAAAADLVNVMYQAGCNARSPEPAHPQGLGYMDVADAAGVQVVTYAAMQASPATYFTQGNGFFQASVDIVFLATGRLADVAANGHPKLIQKDWEPNNFLTSSDAVSYITLEASIVHAKGMLYSFWSDPDGLGNAAGFGPGGSQSDYQTIYNVVDYWLLMIQPATGVAAVTQLTNQIQFLGITGSLAKFGIYYGVGGSGAGRMSDADATALNAYIAANGLSITGEWPNGAAIGSVGETRVVREINGIPLDAVGATGGGSTSGNTGSSDGSAGVGGGSPTFQPSDLGNLIDWWSTASGVAGATTDSSWTGYLGSVLSQTTSTKQPAITTVGDGTKVLTFDGVDDYLTGPLPIAFSASAGEIHFLVYFPAATKARSLLYMGTNSGSANVTALETAAGLLQTNGGASAGTPTVGYHVVSVRWSGLNRYISMDGGTEASATTSGNGVDQTGVMNLCANVSLANPGPFKIKDIILVAPSTSAQFQQIIGWLAWDGGIQGNLPSSSPYKTMRP